MKIKKSNLNIYDIKYINARTGHYFFEEGAMRFFRSRVSAQTFGPYFVTSEQFIPSRGPAHDRRYTVRRLRVEETEQQGSIQEVSHFQEYKSLSGALNRAANEWKAEQEREEV